MSSPGEIEVPNLAGISGEVDVHALTGVLEELTTAVNALNAGQLDGGTP